MLNCRTEKKSIQLGLFIAVFIPTFALSILAQENTNITSTCGGNIYYAAVIQSPNYPRSYPNNVTCSWLVTHLYRGYVVLNFTHFDTEQCCDYVEIRDYDNYLYRLSGKDISKILYIKYQCVITFKTDATVVASGFSLTVGLDDAIFIWITEDLVGSGVITTPNYPEYYPNYVSCYWNLTPRTLGGIVRITFEVCEIGEQRYLYVNDNAGRYFYWYCGTEQPSFIDLSRGGKISFSSSSEIRHRVIRAHFTSLEPLTESECNLNNDFWCSISRMCIHRSWLCDSYADCIHKEDMDGCPSTSTVRTFGKERLSGFEIALIVVGTFFGSLVVICMTVEIVRPILQKTRRGRNANSEGNTNGHAPSDGYIMVNVGRRTANIEPGAHDGPQNNVLSDEMPPSYEHARKQSSSARAEEDLPNYDSAIFTQN